MNERRQYSSPRWLLPLIVVALIAGPLILYKVLPHAGVPVALASGVVIAIVLTHLGVLAVVLTPVYVLFRRRRRG